MLRTTEMRIPNAFASGRMFEKLINAFPPCILYKVAWHIPTKNGTTSWRGILHSLFNHTQQTITKLMEGATHELTSYIFRTQIQSRHCHSVPRAVRQLVPGRWPA